MLNRKFVAAASALALLAGAAYSARAYVPYQVITSFTGQDLVEMGPKSSTQVYAYNGDWLAGHLPVRTLGPSIPGTPTLSSCGGGTPAIVGTDGSGTVTTGTSATTCTITFATAYTNVPNCVVFWQTNIASMVYTVTAAHIAVTQTSESGNKLNYVCMAAAGG